MGWLSGLLAWFGLGEVWVVLVFLGWVFCVLRDWCWVLVWFLGFSFGWVLGLGWCGVLVCVL